jgi:hypothetical protein
MATDLNAAPPNAEPVEVAQATSQPWQDQLVGFILREIDQGRKVRVSLPGSLAPVPIESAAVRGLFVVLTGPDDSLFLVGDLQGVVVLSERQPGSVKWPIHATWVSMDVDHDVQVTRYYRDGKVRRDGIDD